MKKKVLAIALSIGLLTSCAGSALQVNTALTEADLKKHCEARAPLQNKVDKLAEAAETADGYVEVTENVVGGTVGGILVSAQSFGRVIYDIGAKIVNSEKELAADARCATLQK